MIKTHLGRMSILKKLNSVTKYMQRISMKLLHNVIAEVSELVCKSKSDYHKQFARKLTNPNTNNLQGN